MTARTVWIDKECKDAQNNSNDWHFIPFLYAGVAIFARQPSRFWTQLCYINSDAIETCASKWEIWNTGTSAINKLMPDERKHCVQPLEMPAASAFEERTATFSFDSKMEPDR